MERLAIQFCELALTASAHESPAVRADLFEFAGTILDRFNLEASLAARDAAAAIRAAEAAQLTFSRLLKA